MHVVDAVAELLDERARVERLVREMARVEVDAEALAPVDRLQRLARGDEVVRDLGRDAPRARSGRRPRRRRRRSGSSGRRSRGSRPRSPRSRWAGTSRAGARSTEPVKPFTTSTPSLAAARAVSFTLSAARCRTPSGSPSPHTSGGRMARWRSSIGSQTAWPTRCVEIAKQLQAVALEELPARVRVAIVGERRVDVEVVAPAGELEPVEAPVGGLRRPAPRAAGRPTGR